VMKSSRVILGCLVIALLATTASALWEPITDEISLSSLEGGSLIFGDKEVSEFELFGFGAGGALDPNFDQMNVQGGQNSITGDYGLKFNFSWSAISNQTVNATLSFKISILPDPIYDDYFIKDVWLDVSGVSANGTGGVHLGEVVRDTGGNIIASLSCSKQDGDGGAYLVDYDEFAPVKEIWIFSKDVSITGGTSGAAHLSEFYQYYSQIPEPATVLLLGLGSLLFVRRKAKSKHGQ